MAALRSLSVDAELSPLVSRSFTLVSNPDLALIGASEESESLSQDISSVLRTEYRASTNRMLRVAVNGFMESLGVVLTVIEQLDVDVLEKDSLW